jgi:hypothetical protein
LRFGLNRTRPRTHGNMRSVAMRERLEIEH